MSEEKEQILCAKCGRVLGELEKNAWLILESEDVDGSIEESYSDNDYKFCCHQCYKAQVKNDEEWEDADGEEPYTRTIVLKEAVEEEE